MKYKIDVLAELKAAGYSTYKLRKGKILSERTIQLLREGKLIALESIDILCKLLKCQPGDIIEYIEPAPDGAEREENENAE
ncbi:MAG: helix-turn-helix transcriptional regulator [Ruminococcus sp.]|nr:helix-turn-helix transcriptional regulator [Ruminococcus sp.]